MGGQGVTNHGFVFVRTQDDADRRIFVCSGKFALVIAHIHLHLADILMFELAHFQVDQYKTARKPVVKDQIGIDVLSIQRYPLLLSRCL